MSTSRIPLVVAHRGASADHPENTVAAFSGAVEQGADGVELDVRLTASGQLIVHHDAWYLDGRTVWGTPLDDAPSGTCDLRAALDACRGVLVNVEIKNDPGDLGEGVEWSTDPADAVAELLRDRTASPGEDRVIVSSFDAATLDHFHGVAPEVPTGVLVADLNAHPDAPERAVAAGHRALHPWEHFVDADLVERCRALGLDINTWTVDDPVRIAELAALGVAAVITNRPAVALDAVGRGNSTGGGAPVTGPNR